VDGPSRPPLFMSVPLHQVAQQQLAPGATVALEFLAEGIHLMPGDRSPGQLSGAGQHDRENALTI